MKLLSSLKNFLNQPVRLPRPSARGARRPRGRRNLLGRRAVSRPRAGARLSFGHLRRRWQRRPRRSGRIRRGLRLRRSPKFGARANSPTFGARIKFGARAKSPRFGALSKFGARRLTPTAPAPTRAARRPIKLDTAALLSRSRSRGAGRRSGGDVVGLDIQPGFIAAVQADVNGSIRAARVATATLEGDVMPEGEVADEQALSAALRDLFADSGMDRRVRVGVANQRTVLRILEVPPLSDAKELDAAVRFQAQDQVPMPLSNAVLDYHALGVVDTPGGPRQRIVLVAAQRDMIERLVGAVRGAGLRPVGVDLSAFALIRALFKPDAEHAGRVLYLNVDGLTNLAIAEGTSCRFNRVVGVGLEGIAEEMARRSGVSRAQARALLADVDLTAPLPPAEPQFTFEQPALDPDQMGSRIGGPEPDIAAPDPYADPANDAREVREVAMSFAHSSSPGPAAALAGPPRLSEREVRAALEDGIHELVSEVRNTLDFHASQDGGGDVSNVVVSGQALGVPGFAAALQAGLGMEVHAESVEVTDKALSHAPSPGRLAVASGLATVEAPR